MSRAPSTHTLSHSLGCELISWVVVSSALGVSLLRFILESVHVQGSLLVSPYPCLQVWDPHTRSEPRHRAFKLAALSCFLFEIGLGVLSAEGTVESWRGCPPAADTDSLPGHLDILGGCFQMIFSSICKGEGLFTPATQPAGASVTQWLQRCLLQ